MTHPSNPHDHGQQTGTLGLHADPTGQPYFSDAEWLAFRTDDRRAGGTVIVLMTAIFTVGLLLYLGVLFAVMS